MSAYRVCVCVGTANVFGIIQRKALLLLQEVLQPKSQIKVIKHVPAK